jgi:hypothetical protein
VKDTGYILVLRPLASHLPADMRLRAALKRLLRDYKLRCESCAPLPKTAEKKGVTEAFIQQ